MEEGVNGVMGGWWVGGGGRGEGEGGGECAAVRLRTGSGMGAGGVREGKWEETEYR